MSNNVFNVKGESTIKYPRFKNPIEYLRNLSKKYGNKSVTYLEYIFGLKDHTYLFQKIYFNNFTEELVKSLIKIKDYNKVFDQSKCVTKNLDNKITCIRNKAIYFRILFYYFSALNNNNFAEKANKQFFYYFNKFLKLKNKKYSEDLVLNFLDIIFKDLFNNHSFKKITIDSINSQDTLKKHLTILIDTRNTRSTNNKNKNKNLISILNIIIRCKIKEIITDNKKPKQNRKYKISNKQVEDLTLSQIPIELNKQVKKLNSTNKNELINFIIELQHLNKNQNTNLISRITNSKVTKNEIQNMLNEFINVNLIHRTLSKIEQKELFRQNWIQKYMISDEYDITETLSNGDCLFDSIKKAYQTINQNYEINMLREMVSNSINENTYNKYKSFEELDEYNYMKPISNIKQFKNHIKQESFWADDYSIKILEQNLNMKLIIFSENIYFTKKNNVTYKNTNVIKCTLSTNMPFKENESIINQEIYNPENYIMVTYSGDHYRLITYNDKSIFTFEEIPHEVKVLIVNNCIKNIKNKESYSSFSIISKFDTFKNNLSKKKVINN